MVVGAAATHLVQHTVDGGLQVRMSERATRLFFAALFGLIGGSFLVASTLFRNRFR